jgi:hypothetical protein
MSKIRYTQTKAERDRVALKRRLMAAIALCWGADLMGPDEAILTDDEDEILQRVNLAMFQIEGPDFHAWRQIAIKDGMAAVRGIARELGL